MRLAADCGRCRTNFISNYLEILTLDLDYLGTYPLLLILISYPTRRKNSPDISKGSFLPPESGRCHIDHNKGYIKCNAVIDAYLPI